jgi:hypothetical protein
LISRLKVNKLHRIKVALLLMLAVHISLFNVAVLCGNTKCCHTAKVQVSEKKHSCCSSMKQEAKKTCPAEKTKQSLSKLSTCNCVHQSAEENSYTFYKSFELNRYEFVSQINNNLSLSFERIPVELSDNEFRINSPPIYLTFSSLLI